MTDEERSAVDELVDRLEWIEAERDRGSLSDQEAMQQVGEAWRNWLDSDAEDAMLLRHVLRLVSGQTVGEISKDAFWNDLNEARAAWLSEEFSAWFEGKRDPT